MKSATYDYRYIIGIDLGTTNSAVTYVSLDQILSSKEKEVHIHVFKIPQKVAPEEIGERAVLPSFLYLPGPYESSYIALPWEQNENPGIVGEFAREQGALQPHRLVSSAKSWLCHRLVDRKSKILPWGSKEEAIKVSPVEASARYLKHIKDAWNYKIVASKEEFLFEKQLIIITVPASFDEIARELTVEAAKLAGIRKFVLIEEPLAAFYAWLHQNNRLWKDKIKPNQIVLVCDVGGGTSDFTIIALKESKEEAGNIHFDRLAVGEHLLLGGDNMDVAIARHMEMKLFGKVGGLDARRFHQLCHQARKAKELLLSDNSLDSTAITLLGTGAKLIGDSVTGTITSETIHTLVVDGFFPFVSVEERPKQLHQSGLLEWGLPYVQDPAITRHIAWFWRRFERLVTEETGRAIPHPDFILFNGGALIPKPIRSRIIEVLGGWFNHEPHELENPRPDLAVAFGATYYGLAKIGLGIKIGAGSPRSYYIGLGRKRNHEENEKNSIETMCIVSRGTEEGIFKVIENKPFEIISNKPVSFQIFSSTTRLKDRVGEVLTLSKEEVLSLPPMNTVLRFGKKNESFYIPVNLGLKLTELGTLEVWFQSLDTPHKWQLQFDIRDTAYSEDQDPEKPQKIEEIVDHTQIDYALEAIKRTFEIKELEPSELPKTLSAIYNLPKDKWSITTIRKMADLLMQLEKGRHLSFHHEIRWLNLLGFCLRPGYGDPLDEWRMRNIWKIYPGNLCFPKQPQCRLEWWIFWRRVAGGLTGGQQHHIFQNLSQYFQETAGPKAKKVKFLSPQETIELWMMVANFERLSSEIKAKIGRMFLKALEKSKRVDYKVLWSIGKLGARIPLYGPIDKVIPPEEASKWISDLMEKVTNKDETFVYTLLTLARKTGDRARDLKEDFIQEVLKVATKIMPESMATRILEEPSVGLSSREQEWSFGETLPPGLILNENSIP